MPRIRRIRRILHATDFSGASKRALGAAVDFARHYKAELLLVHVLVPNIAYPADSLADPVFYVEIEKTTRRQAEAHLEKLVHQTQKARVKVKGLLLRGTAHEQIVRAARNRRADMIVIGTHGRAGLRRLLMGSVAGRVVSEATVPVLTVRGK
jgi:nucleotide-binding universal stress UspA family protein